MRLRQGKASDATRAQRFVPLSSPRPAATTPPPSAAVLPGWPRLRRALQTEYSLWTRNPELGVLDACRELGVAFVAFSPLARGYLSGALRDVATLGAKDIRRAMPRFAPDAYAANLRLLDLAADVVRDAGCTLAQASLAWLLQRGEHVIPIPGTTRLDHLEENVAAATATLPADVIAGLDAILNARTVAGARYSAATLPEIDTEDFD